MAQGVVLNGKKQGRTGIEIECEQKRLTGNISINTLITDQIDLFNLSDLANNSLNYLTTMTDKRMNYLPYWLVAIDQKPAYGMHSRVDDAELSGSFTHALVALSRMVEFDEEQRAAQQGIKDLFLEDFGEAGLRYSHSYPWIDLIYSNIHEQGYILGGLVALFEQTGDQAIQKKIDMMISGLREICISKEERFFWHGNYPQHYRSYYFPFENYFPGKGWDGGRWTGRSEETTRNGGIIDYIVHYLTLTGDKNADDLAEGMINHVVYDSRKFGVDSMYIGHVHAAMWTVRGVLRYGIYKNRYDLIMWAKNAYDYTRKFSSSWGWVPEYLNRKIDSFEVCETCCISDMIRSAIMLVQCGYSKYWEDVDRFLRNHLKESQVVAGKLNLQTDSSVPDTNDRTYKDIEKRVIGVFSGGTDPNHFASHHGFRAAAACCGATGPLAVYEAWNSITMKKDGMMYVNLLIDRDTEWLTVKSHLPNNGRVELTVKEELPLCIYIPEFAGEKVSVLDNGTPRTYAWQGDYIRIDKIEKGTTLNMVLKCHERKMTERVAGIDYDILWKGNTVLNMLPISGNAESSAEALYKRRPIVDYEPSRL